MRGKRTFAIPSIRVRFHLYVADYFGDETLSGPGVPYFQVIFIVPA